MGMVCYSTVTRIDECETKSSRPLILKRTLKGCATAVSGES